MNKAKKSIGIILTVFMLIIAMTPAFAQQKSGYTITNPYENIDWDSVNSYKTALHTHTNASDGDPTLKESIERHVEAGFDIVATTDHGTVNYSWETENSDPLIHGVLSLVGRTEGDLEYLGKEGTFANGISYTLSTDQNGDDYLRCDNGRTVMRVPYGIENNAVSVNAHVNGWFCDYHNNFITTYKDAVRGVQNNDGVCVINHPGEYSKARYEIRSENAYNENEFQYWYHINKFADLLEKYDRCIGIDINSKGDGRTRFDRILWDKLLTRFSSNGENVYAICSSDAHQCGKIDTGFTYALMNTLDSASLKKALLAGEFIGGSHCLGNPDELKQIAASLKEFYGETDLYNSIVEMTVMMDERVEEIENGDRDADDDIGYTFEFLGEGGYFNGTTQPMVTSISVDEENDSITINASDSLIVRWISDGNLIATTKADGTPFSLADYSDKLGNYVRAEVFGDGGILYVQPFLLNAEELSGTADVVDKGFFDFGVLDFLVGVFGNWSDIIGRTFSNLF